MVSINDVAQRPKRLRSKRKNQIPAFTKKKPAQINSDFLLILKILQNKKKWTTTYAIKRDCSLSKGQRYQFENEAMTITIKSNTEKRNPYARGFRCFVLSSSSEFILSFHLTSD